MAIKRTSNPFLAFYWHLHGGKGFRSDYFWTLLCGGRSFKPSRAIWDYNHPDWSRRSPLAIYDDVYQEFDDEVYDAC